MELLQNSSVWILFSFVIFVYVAYKYGRASVINGLDAKINRIKTEIETAEKLYADAKALLEDYQVKQKAASKEAHTIIENARKQAEELKVKADFDFKQALSHREDILKERIIRMEEKTRDDLRRYAAELAVSAASQIISQKMDDATAKKLSDSSIAKATETLN